MAQLIDCWCGMRMPSGRLHYMGDDPENGPAHAPGEGCPSCGGDPDHEPEECGEGETHCTLEFEHGTFNECNTCGSQWAQWGTYGTLDQCLAEAKRQNDEWRKNGSKVLKYRVIITIAEG